MRQIWLQNFSMDGEMLRWREEQNRIQRPESVDLLTMAQAFATELVHAATCTPGLVEVAREALKLPMLMVEQARAASQGIESLLARLAPLPAANA